MPISTIGQNGLQQSRILTAVQQPAGAVLQVVQGSYGTQTSTTNTASSPVTTGLSATITPSSSNSKILINAVINGVSTNGSIYCAFCSYLLRNSTYVFTSNQNLQSYSISTFFNGQVTTNYLDSPATTSAITYSIAMSIQTGGAGTIYAQANTNTSYIQLMEIAA